MQNLFDTAECQESANRATAVRSLNHVNARMPARGPTQILLRMPCAGPIQQEGLAQILRQRKASEYRKTCRGRSPCGHSARTREPRRGLIKIKKAPARRATPIRPPRRTMPQDAERPARDDPPAVPARPTMPGGAVCAATPIGPPATPLPPPKCKEARRGQHPPAGLSRRAPCARPGRRCRPARETKSALRERDALPSRSLALQYSRRRRA